MHHATLYTHALRYSPLQLIHTHIYIHHIIAHNYYSLMESTHVSIYHAQRSSYDDGGGGGCMPTKRWKELPIV